MRTSDTLINKIQEFEGLRLTAYKCPAGVWTIGAGHTRGVRQGQTITKAQAISLLKGDLLPCEKAAAKLHALTQGQFDAVVDFCFNMGVGAFEGSTLRRKIVAKEDAEQIKKEFKRWIYADGKKLAGLVKRRAWEAEQWDK